MAAGSAAGAYVRSYPAKSCKSCKSRRLVLASILQTLAPPRFASSTGCPALTNGCPHTRRPKNASCIACGREIALVKTNRAALDGTAHWQPPVTPSMRHE